MANWDHEQSEAVYNVSAWGRDYVSVGQDGNLRVWPEGPEGPPVDLFGLTETLRRRGLQAPLLLRFDGILRARVRELNQAFQRAIEEYDYGATYRGVYPIKVNQGRYVVEGLLAEGREHGLGLEVGSKPELVAGIAIQAGAGSLMICNGYKDEEYVEMALRSTQLGIETLLVIEKFTELDTVLKTARRLGIRPTLGIRTKLSFRASGRWRDSVGDRSKFGLTTREIVRVVETLREQGMLDCLQLLHFHIGSQVPHIRSIKSAMREATNTFLGLASMGVQLRWFDVGGGLGVDYDGSQTNFESSKNYSLQEYANDVVWHLGEACREAQIEPPTIVSESGRALVAHHAVLVTEVVGVSGFRAKPPEPDDGSAPDIVKAFADLRAEINEKNYLECYHDAMELREQAMLLFNTHQLSLPDRARVEDLYWTICVDVLRITRTQEYVPEDLEHLERELSDTYFLNMSIFQSIPDAWAIGQLFPVLPIHRLDEEPRGRAVLADLTCDSDGKLDRFIDLRGVKRTLEVHEPEPGKPYYLGFFLVGAYQEILGDMHNLFGDTNVVHVDLDPNGRPKLTHVVRGDRVKEVLSYVEYFEEDLLRNLRIHVEAALERGTMDYEESALFWKRYEEAFRGYTYLTRQSEGPPAAAPKTEGRDIEDSARQPG